MERKIGLFSRFALDNFNSLQFIISELWIRNIRMKTMNIRFRSGFFQWRGNQERHKRKTETTNPTSLRSTLIDLSHTIVNGMETYPEGFELFEL